MIDIFYSRVACNTYIMYNENDEGFIVDPGFSLNNSLVDHILKVNKSIKGILITHGHYDHVYALEDVCNIYKDAKVYILKDEFDVLTKPKYNLSTFKSEFQLKPIKYCPKNLVLLDDGDEFEIAGFKIKVIATPFHTKGSTCYYVERESVLFTGDTLFYATIGRTDLPTGSERTKSSSLAKLLKLPDGIKAYPGHGAITELDREKKYNSYLKNI